MRNRQLIFTLVLTLLLHLWMPSQAQTPKLRHLPRVARTKTIAPIRSFPFPDYGYVYALSPDDTLIAITKQTNNDLFAVQQSGGQKKIYTSVWKIADGRLLCRFPSDGEVKNLAFSPDSKSLAILNFMLGSVKNEDMHELSRLSLWNISSGRRRFQVKVSNDYGGMGLDFSQDGRTLAFGSTSNSAEPEDVRLMSARTGRKLKALTGLKGGLLDYVSISPNGRRIVATSGSDESMTGDEMALWDRSGKRLAYVDATNVSDSPVFFLSDNKTVIFGKLRLRYHPGHRAKPLAGDFVQTWEKHNYEPLCATGNRSVLCYNATHGEVIRWDFASSRSRIVYRLSGGKLLGSIQANNKVLSGVKHKRIFIWRLSSLRSHK